MAFNLLENGEWAIVHRPARKMIDTRYSPDDLEYQEIMFNLVIQRKPLFYIINVILPCSLISLLVVLAYFLPAQGQQRPCWGSLEEWCSLEFKCFPVNGPTFAGSIDLWGKQQSSICELHLGIMLNNFMYMWGLTSLNPCWCKQLFWAFGISW